MRSVLNKLDEFIDRMDTGSILELCVTRDAVAQQLKGRADLYHALRNASSWDEVMSLLSASGYTFVQNSENFIAADMRTGLMFSLWDCGHNRCVFEERLGRFPDSPPANR